MKKSVKLHIMRSGLALGIVVTMLATQPMLVDAVRSVSEIQKEQDDLQKELSSLDSELVSIVSEMATIEADINEKEAEIQTTEEELVAAEEAVDRQYEAMKVRIQYMYENSNDSVLTILLESGSISDFLNRIEYMNSVYSYDRDVLDSYEATKQEVEDMKTRLQEEKAELVSAEASLQSQQSQLDAMIASKEDEMEDIKSELATAKALAAQQAALERAAQQAALDAQIAGNDNSGASADAGTSDSSDSADASEDNSTDNNPSNSTGVSGSAIVSYANSFVGGKYTWGGTDPANGGADCSGFVYYVLKHFGLSSGRLTSAGYRTVGKKVDYKNIQPGDIVCYSGHVAIYAGGGKIVEAQSTKAGITNTRSVNCQKIVAIRRVV